MACSLLCVQYRHFTALHVIGLHRCVVGLCCFLYKLKARPYTNKKIRTCFIETHLTAVLWNQTHSKFKVSLYLAVSWIFTSTDIPKSPQPQTLLLASTVSTHWTSILFSWYFCKAFLNSILPVKLFTCQLKLHFWFFWMLTADCLFFHTELNI